MAAVTADRLTTALRLGLASVAHRLDAAGVRFVVGGSAMLRCRGLDVAVGDLDLCVAGTDLSAVLAACGVEAPDIGQNPPEPWRSGWLVRTEVVTTQGPVAVDIIGDLAIEIDGAVARFPLDGADVCEVEGVPVAFASMWCWYHIYRVYNPPKAALIAAAAGPGDLERAALELGI